MEDNPAYFSVLDATLHGQSDRIWASKKWKGQNILKCTVEVLWASYTLVLQRKPCICDNF